MMAAGVPLHSPFAMHSAAAPATCGDAMLVPEMVLYPPPFHVDRMHTPGAATVCPSSAGPAKLLKSAAAESSVPARHVAAAPPPGCPS
ncbi:MAG: hypothetical protein DMG00_22620 [Acidobacteria bacterium]|nr:MAG: hypothetical protein DMG00_22620 [Acidobacteriota bacterium]